MSGLSTPCSSHVHAADAQHGVVEVVAVEHAVVEVLHGAGIAQHVGVVLAQVLARRHQEAAGAAGRVADDVLGRGRVISTISWMMWRGVRNWPFCPALAILPSMYS
jgi:hypothetical protein